MKYSLRFLTCILLCLCMLLFHGCGPSPSYLKGKEQGLYPDTGDFPNTKWVCREIDLCFYMLDYAEDYMIGSYIVSGKSYRVVGIFAYDRLNFEIYSTTQIAPSELVSSEDGEPFVHCERISCGSILTNYLYENGIIRCSLRNYQSVEGESIPSTLTFEKTETIAQNCTERWYAQELDMYLDSFSDVDGYFRGEIIIDDQKCYVHAFEIGNNNFFMLSIENGKINNLLSQTSSSLVCMWFEMCEDKIIAKISDDFVLHPEIYPYWNYNGADITFSKICVDEFIPDSGPTVA